METRISTSICLHRRTDVSFEAIRIRCYIYSCAVLLQLMLNNVARRVPIPLRVIGLIAYLVTTDSRDRITAELSIVIPPSEGVPVLRRSR